MSEGKVSYFFEEMQKVMLKKNAERYPFYPHKIKTRA